MANYTRTRIHIFYNEKIKESKKDFIKLENIIRNNDLHALCEAFGLYGDDPYLDLNYIETNLNSIDLALYSKGFVPIYNFTEEILDNYKISLYASWCDEDERNLVVPCKDWKNNPDKYLSDKWFDNCWRCGAFRAVVTGYDKEENECIYNEDYHELPYYYPQTNIEKHEVFAMSWDGWKPPSGGDENYFNQLDVDESSILDEEGITIPFADWIESKFIN